MVRAVCVLSLLLLSSVAHAEKRVALVIGNGAYQKVGELPNPTNDAKALAAMLRAARFDDVALHENLGIGELRQAIKDFANLARDTDTAVVYYSGHGIEVNGVNYLIPTDAVLDTDVDVPYEAYSLDNLMQVLEPAQRLRLVMLDACRDNPFVKSMKRTVASRAVGRGLAPVEPASLNTLIGFAAKAGSVALDGEGPNSPYATALLAHIATPGLDLRIAFGRVRDEVLKVTRNKQEPFVYGSLGGTEIALVSTNAAPQLTSAMPPKSVVDYDKEMEITFWNAVKDAKSKSLLETYLHRYPAGNFAGLAKALIDRLNREQDAAVATVAPPAAAAKLEEDAAAHKTKLVRALQTELKRVGCGAGEIDGVWGGEAKNALAEFVRLTKVTIPIDTPSSDALKAVVGQRDRVCPEAPEMHQQRRQKTVNLRKAREARRRTTGGGSERTNTSSSGCPRFGFTDGKRGYGGCFYGH
jgi:hypothetical protein